MPDIERLDRALAHIEAHPEQHNQGAWVQSPGDRVNCGTAACLAGWVVIQEHPEATFVRDKWDVGDTYSHVRIGPDGPTHLIERLAAALLDVDEQRAGQLFCAGNDLDVLKAMRNLLREDPYASSVDLACLRPDTWECEE